MTLKGQASRACGTKFGRRRRVDDNEHITTAEKMKSDGHTAEGTAVDE